MMTGEANVHDYMRVLAKRRWTALAVGLFVFLSVAVATFVITPVFKASALIYIDPGNSAQYSFQQTPNLEGSLVYLQSQVGIIKSDSIARKVVTKLGLYRDDNRGGALAGLLGFFGVSHGSDADTGDMARVRRFGDNLQVVVEKNTNIVTVSFMDEDPNVSALVVNAVVQAYIEQNLEMKVTPAREAVTWLNQKLGDIRKTMGASSEQLQQFKRSSGLIVSGAEQSNISFLGLSDLNAKALAAESRRAQAEIRYHQAQKLSSDPDGLMSIPEVLQDKVVQDLKAQQSAISKSMAELSRKYGEKHPQIQRLKGESEGVKRQLDAEVALVLTSLKNDYENMLREEQNVKGALSRQKSEAMSYEQRSTEYELKKQDVEGAKDIYDAVLKKFQESNVMGNISMASAQLLDRAMPPDRPYRPKKALNLILGLVMGFFTGVSSAFLMEYLDDTFKSPEDVEESLGLPFLGFIPTSKALQSKKREESLIAVANPTSAFAEAFRSVRSSIMLSTGDVRPQVLQICSALHSEGKSTVSTNLAFIMAFAGENVLLIDADMRRPRLHKAFKVPNDKGLSTLLSRQSSLDDVVTPIQSHPNLSLITSGPISPNPGELLGSATMRESIAALRGRFDRIILDCPPYLGLADASILTPLADGTVLVVRSGKTGRDLVVKARKGLDMVKAKTLGVVLNDLMSKSEDYYYRYNYSYYYNKDKKGRGNA